MNRDAARRPSMHQIGVAQNESANLMRQSAARHIYLRSKWIYFGGTLFAVVLALVSPLVLLFRPEWGPLLGATAGAWIFASRLVLEPWRKRLQSEGATAQEMFDCAVLGVEWNRALVRKLPEEVVRREGKSVSDSGVVGNWYPTTIDRPWPESVLLCQRANAVWARRQHKSFGSLMISLAIGWLLLGILVAVWAGASLSGYLVTIALPSLPAILDAIDMSRGHWLAADARLRLEDAIEARLTDGDAGDTNLREIQDQIFRLRLEAPLVPEWYYKLIRPGFEEDMQYAATLQARDDQADPEGGARD